MSLTGSIAPRGLHHKRVLCCNNIKLKRKSIKGKMLNSIKCIFSNMLFGTKSFKNLKFYKLKKKWKILTSINIYVSDKETLF